MPTVVAGAVAGPEASAGASKTVQLRRSKKPLQPAAASDDEGRYAFELPASVRPEDAMGALVASGATIVSLNPLRETLEEFFMRQVAGQPSARRVDS